MAKRWSVKELTNLAVARAKRMTYEEVQRKHFPDRSIASVRSAAQTKKYKEIAEAIEEKPDVFHAGQGPPKFVFDEIGLELDADTFSDLVRSYVRSGLDLTRARVARRVGITRDQMDHICRIYGLTKDSPPVPRETLAQVSDSEIVESVLEAREQGIIEKVGRSRARYFERKYRKLQRQLQDRETVLARLDDWLQHKQDKFGASDAKKRVSGIKRPSRLDIHAPVSDLHAGSQAWAAEVGHNYDTHRAAINLESHGVFVRDIVEDAGGARVAYVTDLGDLFHAILSQTESGTALDKDTRDMKVFDMTFEAKVTQIDLIREVSERVVVISVPGNHDHIFSQLFQRMLKLHYRDAPDVEVRDSYGQFAGFVVGRTAHLLDHGTGQGKLTGWKAKAQVRTVRKHALPAQALDRVRRDVYYVGHRHSLQVDTHTDLELRRLPALAESDEFAVRHRFDDDPGAELYFLRRDGRIKRIERFYAPRDLDDMRRAA